MLCVSLAAMAGTATAAQPGSPAAAPKGQAGARDASFGKGGKVTVGFPSESAGSSGPKYELPFEFTPGHQKMALAPGGKVVVAGAQKIVRYLETASSTRPSATAASSGCRARPAGSSSSPASPSIRSAASSSSD